MATALTSELTRFTDKCNKVLAGGIVKTFEPNSLTPKTSYQDPECTIPNFPEVNLDETGRSRIYLKGDYRIQVYSRDGILIEDNLLVEQSLVQRDFVELSQSLQVEQQVTLNQFQAKADEVIAQGFYTGYATETALKASLPNASEMRARADDTRKIWRWNRTSAEGVTPVTGTWNDTGLSELDLAKDFANSNALFKPVALSVSSNLNDLVSHGIYYAATSSITSIDRNFPTNKGGVLTTTKASISITYQKYDTHEESFVRRLSGGVWSDWLRLATTNIVDSKITEALSAYVSKNDINQLDSRKINSGKSFPQKAMVRGDVTSAMHVKFSQFVLDIKVIGAREGKLYKLDLFTNGSTQSGNKPTGWTISEYDVSTFATSTINDRLQVIKATEDQTPVDRSGVSKIILKSTVVSGLSFEITCDGSKLPPSGTELLRSSTDVDEGYSWIIDPICYVLANTEQKTVPLQTASYNSSNKELFIDFKSGALWYRWIFGINGFNNLPNFKGVSKSPDQKTWTPINFSATDWLPPLRIQAVNNGDGRSKFATGGNHGNVANSAAGEQTARNVLFQVFADGSLLTLDTVTNASVIDVVIVNEVMGWNTTPSETSAGRYVLRQSFNLSFKGSSVEVTANNTALEDINMARDSALQMVVAGLTSQMCFYGKSIKETYVTETTSGKKSDFPDVVAAGAFSADTQLIMWIDHNFGKGDMSWLQPYSPLVRFSGAKCYMAVALDVDENQVDKNYTVPLMSGEKYQYRGGYSLQNIQQNLGIDSSFIKHADGKSKNVILTSQNNLIEV